MYVDLVSKTGVGGGGVDCRYLSVTITEALVFVIVVEFFIEGPPLFFSLKFCF